MEQAELPLWVNAETARQRIAPTLTERHFKTLRDKRLISYYRTGRGALYKTSELIAWIEGCRVGTGDEP